MGIELLRFRRCDRWRQNWGRAVEKRLDFGGLGRPLGLVFGPLLSDQLSHQRDRGLVSIRLTLQERCDCLFMVFLIRQLSQLRKGRIGMIAVTSPSNTDPDEAIGI